MRPDSLTGPPITGAIDNPNGASSPQLVFIAHNWHYRIHTPIVVSEPLGGPLDYLEGYPRLSFTVQGEFTSGVLSGVKYFGRGGGLITLKLNNGHTFTGTGHFTADSGAWMRWAFIGRMFKHLVPSYANRTVSGYLGQFVETCNGNT